MNEKEKEFMKQLDDLFSYSHPQPSDEDKLLMLAILMEINKNKQIQADLRYLIRYN